MTENSIAKGTLQGIVTSACRRLNLRPDAFPIKIGGKKKGGRAVIDWYASVQNADAKVNTSEARKLALVRTTFCISKLNDSEPVKLIIREWSAKKDWGQGYRDIWQADAEDMRAREKMAQIMSDTIADLGP